MNELNTEIFINNIKYKYTKSFKPEKEGLYRITIKFNTQIKDCSFMFCGSKLKSIDLSSFDTKNVINMEAMFQNCESINN
jgi:surface protein